MTEVRRDVYVIPGVDIGPENPFPNFRSKDHPFKPSTVEGVPAEETKLIGWETDFRVLPYRMQDGYTADRKMTSLDAVVLENDYLKAIFCPGLGGHLMSLVHKASNTELLEKNPVFQPRNLALRNAWISGGIEFNAGQLGHHYLTCSPLHTCYIKGPNGEPGLRMYAWDRVKRFTYQIDFYLPEDSQVLYMHVRIVNPHDYEIPMYWWTNIGVPERTDRRVLCPADTCIFNGIKGFELGHLPNIDGYEVTHSSNVKHSMEFFFRMAPGQRRWEASLDGEGRGLIQTSTDRLIGRKLFVWGTSKGGNRWQDYLAAPGSAYVEIQAGLTQTQSESIPMPANTEWTWTETFGLFEGDADKVHQSDWTGAWKYTDAQLETVLPRNAVDKMHEKLDKLALQPNGEMISSGLGWGALERKRASVMSTPDLIPANLEFAETEIGGDQAPWLELLDNGKMIETDPLGGVGHFMIQPEWEQILEKSINEGKSDNWLAWYHLGVARIEKHDVAGAVKAWETSLKKKRTSWTLRNLASLEARDGRREAARALYRDALQTGPVNKYLVKEYIDLLLHMGLNSCVVEVTNMIPESIRSDERIRLTRAWAKVRMDDYAEAEDLFSHEFVTMMEGEGSLASLWFEMYERKLSRDEGIPVDDELKARVQKEFPLPERIDFRVSREVAER